MKNLILYTSTSLLASTNFEKSSKNKADHPLGSVFDHFKLSAFPTQNMPCGDISFRRRAFYALPQESENYVTLSQM